MRVIRTADGSRHSKSPSPLPSPGVGGEGTRRRRRAAWPYYPPCIRLVRRYRTHLPRSGIQARTFSMLLSGRREVGENPTRTRRCKGRELASNVPLPIEFGGKAEASRPKPEDLLPGQRRVRHNVWRARATFGFVLATGTAGSKRSLWVTGIPLPVPRVARVPPERTRTRLTRVAGAWAILPVVRPLLLQPVRCAHELPGASLTP